MSDAPLKRCTKCLEEKSITDFPKHKSGKDGIRSTCKICSNAYSREYDRLHPEQHRERVKRWRETRPDDYKASSRKTYQKYRDKKTARKREWRKANPDKHYAANRRYVESHREKDREFKRHYARLHPEIARKAKHNRRARQLSLPAEFTTQDWQACVEYWQRRCAMCRREVKLAADHWIPLSDPRPDNPGTVPTNIIPLCHGVGSCNNSKSNMNPVDWLVFKLGPELAAKKLAEIEAYFEWVRNRS